MANITRLKKNGDIAAGIWVSLVCKPNLVPSEDVQPPVPEQFDS